MITAGLAGLQAEDTDDPPGSFEYEYSAKLGSFASWFRLQAARVESSSRIVIAHTDVTDQVRGEQALAWKAGHDELTAYPEAFCNSWAWRDLHKVRNVKPGLKWGMWLGTAHGGLAMWLADLGLGGLMPWTLHHKKADNETLRRAQECPKIAYPKPDGVITIAARRNQTFVNNVPRQRR